MARRYVSRRAFLRASGGAMLALPVLSALRVSAQETVAPKRLLLVYSPNGVIHEEWFPQDNTTETGFELRECLKPLEAYKHLLIQFQGLELKVTQTGPGGPHQKGIGGLYTGRELQEGEFMDGCGSRAGWANGISVDQEVAKAIGQNTALPSLELGVRAMQAEVRSRISYAAPGAPLPPMNDPHDVYKRLFSDFQGDPNELNALRERRRSVLDTVQSQFAALDARIGQHDREKLQQHLELVRDVERRLDILPGDGKSCGVPEEPPLLDEDNEDTMEQIAPLQMDMLSMAFACDLVRVASVQFSSAINDIRMPWLNSMGQGHTLSHSPTSSESARQERIRRSNWFAQQLAHLCDRLAAVPEGDGTVLDNTLIVWGNEVSWGNVHSHDNMPFLMIGSAGGYFRTGRYLEYDGDSHNKLLVSILHAMGVPKDNFGHPDFTDGPLAGLT